MFSMRTARSRIVAPASALLVFFYPALGDFRQTCVVNHSNRLRSFHFYSNGLRIFPYAMHIEAQKQALTLNPKAYSGRTHAKRV
ncbi:exported hypothetical protein [Paraburkholderia piptadeniae]|uniref:Uncharacterized protein n=1 Tax=Paraburkholderia piptadeniae TaxID=1701573 RepID=A0A1N7S0W3_9BURK|nr:exported hypothetical protein [Paraburkholderia piptadeniae]